MSLIELRELLSFNIIEVLLIYVVIVILFNFGFFLLTIFRILKDLFDENKYLTNNGYIDNRPLFMNSSGELWG